jgi:hypothetical protein
VVLVQQLGVQVPSRRDNRRQRRRRVVYRTQTRSTSQLGYAPVVAHGLALTTAREPDRAVAAVDVAIDSDDDLAFVAAQRPR